MDLEHLKASDGTGEAVLAHIDAPRNPGSTVLSLDNVDNWNSKAVVVTGTPAANGFIAASGMKVMYGHITAGDFIIDGFAPGYADNGNTTQEIAIVKMTTNWADALVSILQQSLQDSGLLKVTALDHFFKPSELISNFVFSGGTVVQTVALTGSFSDITYYINGLRYTKTAVANKVYTASKDTYVDIGTDGVVDYTEVANGAASPALAADHIRIAKVITSGAAITSVTQGGVDSLTNSVYPSGAISAQNIDFSSIRLAKTTRTSNSSNTGTNTVLQAFPGLSVTFTLKRTATVRITLIASSIYNTAASAYQVMAICNGSASLANAVMRQNVSFAGNNQEVPVNFFAEVTLAPGTYTFLAAGGATGGGTSNITGSGSQPASIIAEIVS